MVKEVTLKYARFVAVKRLLVAEKFRGKIWFEHRRVKEMYRRIDSTDATTAESDARALVDEMLVARARATAMRERDKELRAAIEAAGTKIDATVLTLLLKPQTAHQLFNISNRTYGYEREKSLRHMPDVPVEWFEPSLDNNATFTHSVDYVLRGLAMYVALANSAQLIEFAKAWPYCREAKEALTTALIAWCAADSQPGADSDVLPYEAASCQQQAERVWHQPPLLEVYACKSCKREKPVDQYSERTLKICRKNRFIDSYSMCQLCLECERAIESGQKSRDVAFARLYGDAGLGEFNLEHTRTQFVIQHCKGFAKHAARGSKLKLPSSLSNWHRREVHEACHDLNVDHVTERKTEWWKRVERLIITKR
mmetsp:Transcript_22093/g.37536  ORF Transcript_22093/g.37536 Transcript_22093/m.37536 type:complete len:368 (-) Transcript_22093:163-1266(-)